MFGSKWEVTTGLAAEYLDDGLMNIDIVTLNTDNEFMVLFSDVSNNGVMTAAAGKVNNNT